MDVTRIDDGLWRWTTAHPEWKPGGGWEQDVGSVYWEAEDAVVLVDPLVPQDDAERARFLEALDRDVDRLGRPVSILVTCTWHERSAAELAERFGGTVHREASDLLPAGVGAIESPSAPEVVYWLEGAAAVVPGDVLLGRRGGVKLCPTSWLASGTRAGLARELRPLLDLPVERVLVSHGQPVLADGLAALERAFAGYADA
jgi:glyoxylase-like metal-dependent hydrolase (beta-lactamase superfamily II)